MKAPPKLTTEARRESRYLPGKASEGTKVVLRREVLRHSEWRPKATTSTKCSTLPWGPDVKMFSGGRRRPYEKSGLGSYALSSRLGLR